MWRGLTVHAGGTVYLCCLGCVESCSAGMIIGDVTRQSLREILTGPAVTALRKAHYGGDLSRACCGTCSRFRPGPPGTPLPEDPLDLVRGMEIETTERCNLQCTMCLRTYQEARRMAYHGGATVSDDMPFEQYAAIVAEFASLNPHLKHVHMQWIGEPLMHPRFLDLLAEPLRYPGVSSQVITNGLLLDERTARAIVELEGPMHFEISLNAPDRDSYRAVMGVDAFDVVLRNIKRFLAIRHEARAEGDITVHVKMLVMPETVGGMRRFVSDFGGFLDGLDSAHEVWWNNEGRPALTQLRINPLYADDFCASRGLLNVLKDGNGQVGNDSDLYLATYICHRAELTSARETLAAAALPLRDFLTGVPGGRVTPLIEVCMRFIELQASVEGRGDAAALVGLASAFAGAAREYETLPSAVDGGRALLQRMVSSARHFAPQLDFGTENH